MTKHIFYLIVIFVAQMTFFPVVATEPKQMTMVLQPDSKISFNIAGSGKITIDWGDGSASETYTLLVYDVNFVRHNSFNHDYSVEFNHTSLTITITGENMTHLSCDNLGLTSLDVSKNTVLTNLWCFKNQLTNLDVNKNTVLKNLWCYNNQLTNLDVSKNIVLTDLRCFKNQLTSLDVSKNIALTSLFCDNNQLTNLDASKNAELTDLFCGKNQLTSLDVSKNLTLNRLWCNDNLLTSLDLSKNATLRELCCKNNQLSTVALNELFETLHNNTIPDNWKRICILNNFGIDTCNQSIVIKKGWTVACPDDSVDTPPRFKGKSAEEGFREYIRRKTVYPQVAFQNRIEGIVLVSFVVDKRGKVVDAKVEQSVHHLLDAEALRVVKSSPKWTPGIQWGKEVKVKYTFPFVFKMR